MKYWYEDAKERMVSCTDDELPVVRREAATYGKIISQFTRPSVRKPGDNT